MSKVIINALNTIAVLGAKEEKTVTDFVRIANAAYKVENRKLEQIYNLLVNAPKDVKPHVLNVLGDNKMPKFDAFKAKAPVKEYYSIWNGLQILGKFNTKAALAKKIQRQKEAADKKALAPKRK